MLRVSQLLQIAEIVSADFIAYETQITDRSFIYFDPPYRPISKTSSFTSYSKSLFTDDDQVKLAEYITNWLPGRRQIDVEQFGPNQ